MKANDLMVGDWFQNPLGYPYKVKSIKCYNADKEDEYYKVLGVNKGTEASFDVINAEPIPLSPEILEKNGFKKEGSWFVIEDDYYDVSIRQITESIWRVKYCNIEFSAFDSTLHIGFVHELQHALRLCGVKHDIIL